MQTNRNALLTWLPITLLLISTSVCIAATGEVTAEQVVTAIEEAFGVTKGERRNHIKGTCALGEFVGMPDAAAYSSSPLFSGHPIPVVARFSLAGGNPKSPDTAKSPRGMALEFKLPNGSLQHMAMLNTPIFGAAQPRTVLDLMTSIKPDPATGKPNPGKIKAFKESHPDSLAQAEFLDHNNPPASYANSAYFGIHTFKFINKDNKTTLIRWRFIPQDGEKKLSDAELESMPADFLEEALIERTKHGGVRWDMLISIGEHGDTENNPTIAWPENRKQVRAGTLTIFSAMPQKGAECEKINFDPMVMGDGIAASDDPILLFRSPAYFLSFARRSGGI